MYDREKYKNIEKQLDTILDNVLLLADLRIAFCIVSILAFTYEGLSDIKNFFTSSQE